MNRTDVIESFYRTCNQIIEDAARSDKKYPLDSTVKRADFWFKAQSGIMGAYLCCRMLLDSKEDLDALSNHKLHFDNIVSAAVRKAIDGEAVMVYIPSYK